MEKILIIEDEEAILMPLADDLTLEGYEVSSARDGLEGFTLARGTHYDLIILDLMLPGMNGFDICKKLRAAGITTPILILSAKSQEVDKVLGLELGADDYVTKPFSPRELQSRIKAILRRVKQVQQGVDGIRFGKIEVDFIKYETKRNGKPVYLTSLEYSLLHYLVKHKDQVARRDTILNEVWGDDVYVYPRTVDTHIAHLRKKIEENPAEPRHILNIRGVGYKFVE